MSYRTWTVTGTGPGNGGAVIVIFEPWAMVGGMRSGELQDAAVDESSAMDDGNALA
jgi:hypothetical protein